MASVLFGVLLAVAAAVFIALGMSVQTYGLQTSPPISFLWMQCSNGFVYTSGFLTYIFGNILFAVGLISAPFSLLGGVFITLVFWNLIFGACLLDEEITPPKAIGASVVIIGVILIALATPSGIPTTYTAEKASSFIERTTGLVYVIILVSLMLFSVVGILIFELNYPLTNSSKKGNKEEHENLTGACVEKESSVNAGSISSIVQWLMSGRGMVCEPPSLAIASKNIYVPGLNNTSKEICEIVRIEYEDACPKWLGRIMGIVYPMSLGIDEAIGHLSLKSVMALTEVTVGSNNWEVWIFNGMLLVWVVTSLATVLYLRRMLNRFEVTEVLPLEYGTLMICDVLSGIIYYQEKQDMMEWQLITISAGVVIVTFGVIIGMLDPECCSFCSSRIKAMLKLK